jgi:hypothetical protein
MAENGNGKCPHIPTIIAINKQPRHAVTFCRQFPDEERVLVPAYYTKLAIVWVPGSKWTPHDIIIRPYVAALTEKLMAF